MLGWHVVYSISHCRLTALMDNDKGDWMNELGSSVELVEGMQSPRFIKSHLIWELLPAALDTVKPKVWELSLIMASQELPWTDISYVSTLVMSKLLSYQQCNKTKLFLYLSLITCSVTDEALTEIMMTIRLVTGQWWNNEWQRQKQCFKENLPHCHFI